MKEYKEYVGKIKKDKKGVFIQLPKSFIVDMKLKTGDEITFWFAKQRLMKLFFVKKNDKMMKNEKRKI